MYYVISRCSFLLLIACLYLITAVYYPTVYILLTYEDLFGEWSQTLFFAVAFVYGARLFVAKSDYRWFFLGLAISCFYVFMEEISWGQRLFAIKTPEFFKQHNLQHEMNLHNMLTGPISSNIKTLLEYLIVAAFILYGVVYPSLLKINCKAAQWLERLKIPSPPLYLAPYFALAALLEPEPFNFNEAEIAELLTGITLSILTMHFWYAHKFSLSPQNDVNWPRKVTHRYLAALWTVFILIPVSAYLLTMTLYQSPDMKRRIDNRLYNGYKKFALRYQSYQQWDKANDLLLKIYHKNPKDISNLQAIAGNYLRMENPLTFAEFNQKAIKTGLERYRKYPENVAAILSLAKSYRQRGDHVKVKQYAKKAHRLALSDAKKNPRSASRAFRLGQTLEFIGLYKKAYQQYKKAVQLKPYRLDYRKAYLKTKKRVDKH